MGLQRTYATNAERQAAWRRKKAQERLHQIPVVHGEGYTLYQGDALRLVPLLADVDHCITDPPYEAEAHTAQRCTRAMLEGRAVAAAVPFAPITEAQRRLFTRLTCQWLLVFCQAEAVQSYQGLFGAKYKRACIWEKDDGAPQFTGNRPAMGYESIVCAWGQAGRSSWNGGGKRGVYRHLVREGEPRCHPTQKPLALMCELVRDFTQPGDCILDPFMGSGTTGVACLRLGRRFLGVEQDPGYFALACERLTAEASQAQLFSPPVPPPRQERLW